MMTATKTDSRSHRFARPFGGADASLSRRALTGAVLIAATCLLACPATHGAQPIYPTSGGTIADGGPYGVFDGLADRAFWSFGFVGFSGAVTLTTESPQFAVEHRIVCEYDLRQLNLTGPVQATLNFNTRGAPVLPFPDTQLHVYAYPADLLERTSDYAAAPIELLDVITVSAMQPSRSEEIDISDIVAATLAGNKLLAVRFQIDPASAQARNQVFIDAFDTDPVSKPYLMVRGALAGDADEDGDVDLDDFALFTDCLSGPGETPAPASPLMTPTECLWAFDHDHDEDVDIVDLAALADLFADE